VICLTVRLKHAREVPSALECECVERPTALPDRVKPRLPPWGPHVRSRRVQTLVREGSPLVKLRNAAARFSRLTNGCALECGVGFRQLRTCRRTRPGQLCAKCRRAGAQ